MRFTAAMLIMLAGISGMAWSALTLPRMLGLLGVWFFCGIAFALVGVLLEEDKKDV